MPRETHERQGPLRRHQHEIKYGGYYLLQIRHRLSRGGQQVSCFVEAARGSGTTGQTLCLVMDLTFIYLFIIVNKVNRRIRRNCTVLAYRVRWK